MPPRKEIPTQYYGFTLTEHADGISVRCPRGHVDLRPRASVRRSLARLTRLTCDACPTATRTQLQTMRALQAHQEEHGSGMRRREVAAALKIADAITRLKGLEIRGWVEREEGLWWLTDDGFDQLERAEVAE